MIRQRIRLARGALVLPLEDLPQRLKEIRDRMSDALHYSMDAISSFCEEERERLMEVRARKEEVLRALQEAIAAADRSESEYRKSRAELLVASRAGNEQREKSAYEKAAQLMRARGACEEREKQLAGQRDDLAREERRIEKLLARSEEMGNRFRVAQNLLNMDFGEGGGTAATDGGDLLSSMLFAERESISLSRDLHDGPVQKFAGIGLMIDITREYLDRGDLARTGEELTRTRAHLGEALSEMRSFIFQLNPSGLKDGLFLPLNRLASQVAAVSGCDVRFSIEGGADVLTLQARTAVFKIVQQAVLNSVHSGKARNVRILVCFCAGSLRARITDDGVGFDVEEAMEHAGERGAWGLVNMRERARMIGGEVRVESEIGRGTTVILEAPLPREL